MAHGHNYGSALEIVLEYSTIKEAKTHVEITSVVFPKKFSFRAIGQFWIFFNFAPPERSKNIKIILMVFH